MKAKERHDIKTDKFLDIMVNVEAFVVRHARLVAWASLSIIIILIAWFGTTSFINGREDLAATALNPLIEEFNSFQSETEVDPARAEKLESSLNTVIEQHGGTAAAVSARYFLASVYQKTGKFEESETLLRDVFATRHPLLWQSAASDLGTLLESQGNYEEAASIYSTVADSGSSNIPFSLFAWRAGQCYEKLGDSDKAISFYNRAKQSQELPLDSLLARKIETKIQQLTAED